MARDYNKEREEAENSVKEYLESKGFKVEMGYGPLRSDYGVTMYTKHGNNTTFIHIQNASLFGMKNGKSSNESINEDRRNSFTKAISLKNWLYEGNNPPFTDGELYYVVYQVSSDGKISFLKSNVGNRILIRMGDIMDKEGNSKIEDVKCSYSYGRLGDDKPIMPF